MSSQSASFLPLNGKDQAPKKKSKIIKPAIGVLIAGCAGAAIMYACLERGNKGTKGTIDNKGTNLTLVRPDVEENTNKDDDEKKVDTTQTPKDNT